MNPPTVQPADEGTRAGSRLSLRAARIDFAIFAAVTSGLCWAYVAMDRVSGASLATGNATSTAGTSGQGLWILVPALTSLILGLRHRRRGFRVGLGLPRGQALRGVRIAVALPVAATGLIVLLGVLTGLAHVSFTPAPGGPGLLAGLGAVLPFLILKNVVEEFIFRGYGTPAASALGARGVWPHLLVGVVWAAWHVPLYLVWMSHADYLASTSLPLAVYLPMFALGTMAIAIVLGELRLLTASIWPGVLLHTVAGALAAVLLIDGHLELSGLGDALLSPNANSIASTLIFAGAGLALLRQRQSRAITQLR